MCPFRAILASELQIKIFPKKLMSILSLYAAITLWKLKKQQQQQQQQQKNSESQFSIKLEETNLGLILSFLARKPHNKIFIKYFA